MFFNLKLFFFTVALITGKVPRRCSNTNRPGTNTDTYTLTLTGKVPAMMLGVRVTTSLIIGALTKAFFCIFVISQYLVTVSDDVKFAFAC